MIRNTATLIACLFIPLLAACSTAPEPAIGAPLDRQITALSNDVQRLLQRMEQIEQQWAEVKPFVDYTREVMEEMRNEPVTESELIGVE